MSRLKPGELLHNWEYHLKQALLQAGTVGLKQGEIMKKFGRVSPDDILMHLEALWAEESVQRFTQRTHGVSATIWRATEKFND